MLRMMRVLAREKLYRNMKSRSSMDSQLFDLLASHHKRTLDIMILVQGHAKQTGRNWY